MVRQSKEWLTPGRQPGSPPSGDEQTERRRRVAGSEAARQLISDDRSQAVAKKSERFTRKRQQGGKERLNDLINPGIRRFTHPHLPPRQNDWTDCDFWEQRCFPGIKEGSARASVTKAKQSHIGFDFPNLSRNPAILQES